MATQIEVGFFAEILQCLDTNMTKVSTELVAPDTTERCCCSGILPKATINIFAQFMAFWNPYSW